MKLQCRATPVTVTWVKGHAKLADVASGRTTHEDMVGNNGADELAVLGAAQHEVCPDVVAAAFERRRCANMLHSMMVDIVVLRRSLEASMRDGRPASALTVSTSEPDIGDRGSDMGDCDCLDMHVFSVQVNSSLDDEFD